MLTFLSSSSLYCCRKASGLDAKDDAQIQTSQDLQSVGIQTDRVCYKKPHIGRVNGRAVQTENLNLLSESAMDTASCACVEVCSTSYRNVNQAGKADVEANGSVTDVSETSSNSGIPVVLREIPYGMQYQSIQK